MSPVLAAPAPRPRRCVDCHEWIEPGDVIQELGEVARHWDCSDDIQGVPA